MGAQSEEFEKLKKELAQSNRRILEIQDKLIKAYEEIEAYKKIHADAFIALTKVV